MASTRRTAVVGVGQTEFSKDSGRSELQLASEAIRNALRDAGLTPADVDGVVSMTADTNDDLYLIRSAGIHNLRWSSRVPYGGGGSAGTVQHAVAAIESGLAETVVVYRAFNERSGRRFGQPGGRIVPPEWNWYQPYGLDTPAKIYALWYQRYMTAYGVTNEDFGRYSVVARKHAATNPDAWFYGRPITLADHQSSRWIVEPIMRLLDICQESDGGVAMVLTSAERARDLPHPPAYVAGAVLGQVMEGDTMFNYHVPDLARFPQAEYTAEQLWKSTGLSPADMDTATLYDAQSPSVFYQLEAYGFCGPGEARDYIVDGHIELGGSCPVNTHGGLLGEAYIHGINSMIEGVRQIRGTAANQVDGAQHVLCSSGMTAVVFAAADAG